MVVQRGFNILSVQRRFKSSLSDLSRERYLFRSNTKVKPRDKAKEDQKGCTFRLISYSRDLISLKVCSLFMILLNVGYLCYLSGSSDLVSKWYRVFIFDHGSAFSEYVISYFTHRPFRHTWKIYIFRAADNLVLMFLHIFCCQQKYLCFAKLNIEVPLWEMQLAIFEKYFSTSSVLKLPPLLLSAEISFCSSSSGERFVASL